VAGLIEATTILEEEPEIQQRLHRNACQLREGLVRIGLDTLDSRSAVIPVLMPDTATTMRFTRLLHDDGIFVNPALHPAVSALRPRLRINVGAALEQGEIDVALASFERCARRLRLGRFDAQST
jgi:glycine C-acetyltransferase